MLLLANSSSSTTLADYEDKFIPKTETADSLSRPSNYVRSLAILETNVQYELLTKSAACQLKEVQAKAATKGYHGRYDYLGTGNDHLFQSSYRHKHHRSSKHAYCDCFGGRDTVCDAARTSSCAELGCDVSRLVARGRPAHPEGGSFAVYMGPVASGDGVIRSATDRDLLAKKLGVIAFEMEGAGVWDVVLSVVIKGVCDYADSHNNKEWQNYAAAAAAAVSKVMLEEYI